MKTVRAQTSMTVHGKPGVFGINAPSRQSPSQQRIDRDSVEGRGIDRERRLRSSTLLVPSRS
jgi:hypothetical protein